MASGLSGGSSGAAYSGGGGGSLSGGSSGAAYSGASSGYSGSSRSSPFSPPSLSEAERRRLEELMRQQQMTAAAQALAPAAAPPVLSPADKLLGATAPPLAAQSPAEKLLSTTLQPPGGEINRFTTPYGTVTGTIPVETREVANPFLKPETPIQSAAEAYRSLSPTATPEQRAEAMSDYRNALLTEKGGLRQAQAAGEHKKAMEARVATMADVAAKRFPNDPEQRAAFVENYRALDPERQKIAYYKETSGIEKPYMIGTAQLKPGGGLSVPTIKEETASRTVARKSAKELADFQREEQQLLHPVDEKGQRQQPSLAERQAAAEVRDRWERLGTESGLIDPANPKAGVDVERAARFALDQPRGTLTELVKREPGKPKTKEPEARPAAEDAQERFEAMTQERAEAEQAAWEQEFARRRAEIMGRYAYNY